MKKTILASLTALAIFAGAASLAMRPPAVAADWLETAAAAERHPDQRDLSGPPRISRHHQAAAGI